MSKIENWEQIDDYMQRGYSFEEKHDSVSACKEWKQAWELIVSAMDSGGYETIRDFDDDFGGLQSVFNWSSDYEMELGNASRGDDSFAHTLIDFCTEYLERTDRDELNSKNMQRAIAETYFDMGMADKGEKEFERITGAYPTWAWGWIGWADKYSLFSKNKDFDKAIQLLTHALEIEGIEDKAYIKERLKDVYKACGMDEEADSINISDEDSRRIPLSEYKNLTSNAKSGLNGFANEIAKTPMRKEKTKIAQAVKKEKIPRNAPCPCGSGRKYKHCCGKN